MGSTFDALCRRGLVGGAPAFLMNNVQYEVVMGFVARGLADDYSDLALIRVLRFFDAAKGRPLSLSKGGDDWIGND